MRPILAVGLHELRRLVPRHRGSVALLVAVVAAAALLAPLALRHGVDPSAGLYPVAVEPGAELGPAVAADTRFRVVDGTIEDVRAGRIDLHIGTVVTVGEGRRAAAALQALDEATKAWLDATLEQEADQEAAFPVQVNVLQEPRSTLADVPGSEADGGLGPDGDRGGPDGVQPGDPPVLVQATGGTQRTGLRPDEVEPPFPIRSLVLSFAYLIPLNFVAQLYAGSLLSDRIRRRGLILLSGPLAPWKVLAGRSLPYLGLGALVWLVAGLLIGTGWTGWLASLPIVAFVLAAAMLIGILARSERELTFLLTAATTMFATFLFLPAVFTAIPAIAFISPVSVVAASIRGEAVGVGAFLTATVPLALVVTALSGLGAALYREETLFSPRKLASKVLDGVARVAATRTGLLLAGVFLLPFAMALELFVLALVIPLGLTAAFPLFIVGVALVEEGLKLMPALARRRHGLSPPAWHFGLLVGGGFFLGEKLALVVALAGFGLLPLGSQSLALWGVGGLVLLIAPLGLHVAAVTVSSSGAGRSRLVTWGAYLGAVLLHLGYNALVVIGGTA